jgi:hypothetical protein
VVQRQLWISDAAHKGIPIDDEPRLIDEQRLLIDAELQKCEDAEYRDGCVAPLRKTAKHKLATFFLF